jgi:hypothetical protein
MDVFSFLISDSLLSRLGNDKFAETQNHIVSVTTNQTALFYANQLFVEIAIDSDRLGGIDVP